jgi:hypothetical protein
VASQRTSFDKLQRDRAKKAKAAAKREKRLEGTEGEGDRELEETPASPGNDIPAEEVLKRLEELHARYDAEQIEFEEFEKARAELLARLTVD